MKNLFRSCCIFLTVLVLSSAGVAVAQLDTGSIQGTVRDSTGAVIPGATITVTNEGTQRTYNTTSNRQGEYNAPTLPVGIYTVTASYKGFGTAKILSIPLNASELHRTDVTLKPGSDTEQVTVTSNQMQVNTMGADLGTTIDANRVANLPLNGRDFSDLLALVPGSVTSGQFGQTSLGGAETSFAGVNILLDGADATRIDTNATSMQLGRGAARITRASVDSIAEFHILQGNFSAEYGRSIGDVVNVITKSGTNSWHGEAFDFLRNDALDARNYFAVPGSKDSAPPQSVRRQPRRPHPARQALLLHQLRGRPPDHHQHPNLRCAERGQSREVHPRHAARRRRHSRSAISAPTHRTPPATSISTAPTCVNTLREDTGSVRIDWNPSETNKFYVRYNIGDSNTNTTYGPAVGQNAPTPARTQFLKISNTHTFSPTLLNEAGFGINSDHVESYGGGGPFPVISFSCFFCNFGAAPGPATFASIRPQTSYQYIDTLTKVLGRQTIKAGADIRHNLSDELLGLQEFLSYGSISDFENNNGFAFSTLGNPMTRIRNTNYDFFAQDDIRLARTFTLNLGVRYEYNTVLHERDNQLANFDIATQTVGTKGAPLYKPDYNNFAPRVGFSWDPFGLGKTVVRGGFGVFYNPQLTGAVFSLTDNTSNNISVNVFQALFGTVSCTPSFPLSYPVATVPTCVPQVRNVDEFDPHTRDSYAYHYSFGVQQELAPNTVLEMTYAADRGIKLPAGAAFAGLQFNNQNPITGAYPLSQNLRQRASPRRLPRLQVQQPAGRSARPSPRHHLRPQLHLVARVRRHRQRLRRLRQSHQPAERLLHRRHRRPQQLHRRRLLPRARHPLRAPHHRPWLGRRQHRLHPQRPARQHHHQRPRRLRHPAASRLRAWSKAGFHSREELQRSVPPVRQLRLRDSAIQLLRRRSAQRRYRTTLRAGRSCPDETHPHRRKVEHGVPCRPLQHRQPPKLCQS